MIKRRIEMKGVILCLISIFIIAGWLLGSATQTFAETRQYKLVMQVSKSEVFPAGDVADHTLAMSETRGLLFVGGEVAVYTGWNQADTIKGIGVVRGYAKEVYQDGSTTIRKTQFKQTIAPDGKGALLEDGKSEFIMGTGRFDGIKGGLTFKGRMFTPISIGLKETRGDMVYEGTMTYTLPSK